MVTGKPYGPSHCYNRVAGEYWIIDPERRQAAFYRRGRGGVFRPVNVGDDGTFRSTVLKGLWLRVHWLWDRPPLMAVLKEWGLV